MEKATKKNKNLKLFRGSAGLTYKATENLALRLHRDISPRETYGENAEHQNISTAAMAYFTDDYSLGLEYNLRENTNNVLDNNSTGLSAYMTYRLNNGLSLFGRYDEMSSDEDWNITKDGTFTIFGIEKQMTKGVKVAANIQSFQGAEANAEQQNTFFLNLEYKF